MTLTRRDGLRSRSRALSSPSASASIRNTRLGAGEALREDFPELWPCLLPRACILPVLPVCFYFFLRNLEKELKSSMCNCRSEAKGTCWPPSLPVLNDPRLLRGRLQVRTHIWLGQGPRVTLRMTLKVSSGSGGPRPGPHPGPALSQMFPGPLGDLVHRSRDVTPSSSTCTPRGLSWNGAETSTHLFCLSVWSPPGFSGNTPRGKGRSQHLLL